jgi:hypothetical protein
MLATIEHGDDSGTHFAVELDSYVLAAGDSHLSHTQLAARHSCRNEEEPPVCHPVSF